MESVLVVQTGGTIDKDIPPGSDSATFEMSEAAALKILRTGLPTFNVQLVPACRKDSSDITDQDREQVLKHIEEAAEGSRILVTHGTDTMIETANYVQRALDSTPLQTVVVFTGALKPARVRGSDAAFNIGVAVGALNVAPPGVYIAMSGTVLKCRDATRNLLGQFVCKVPSDHAAEPSEAEAGVAQSEPLSPPGSSGGPLPAAPQMGPPSRTTLNVNAGAMRTITIPVERGHCIVWKIQVEHFDIGFSVHLRNGGSGGSAPVVELERGKNFDGEFRIPEQGSLVLTLHNTHSWMTMKTVHSEICRKS